MSICSKLVPAEQAETPWICLGSQGHLERCCELFGDLFIVGLTSSIALSLDFVSLLKL